MYTIPFHEETFTPTSIPGNDTADKPVTFTLSQIGGADLMRLRGLVYATAGFAHLNGWNKDIQANVLDAFREAPTFFVRGIDKVSGLSVPFALASKAGIAPDLKPGESAPGTVLIQTGTQFAAISPYVITLAFEVAMAIAKLSADAEIDPRFFGLGSGSRASNATRSGSAHRARRPRAPRGTAGNGPATVN